MLVGWHVLPTLGGVGTLERAGGVAHGLFAKSKKSSRPGCAASRRVSGGSPKRCSTKWMMAVWSMAVCPT